MGQCLADRVKKVFTINPRARPSRLLRVSGRRVCLAGVQGEQGARSCRKDLALHGVAVARRCVMIYHKPGELQPLSHTALDQNDFPGVTGFCTQIAGRGRLVPVQPIGYLRLANFDAA